MSDPRDQNRKLWDEWAEAHVGSEFYDVPGFLAGGDNLTPQVLDAIGDVSGKRVLHLQCHFGMDTLALARRGAEVTGVDFSPKAIAAARDLAAKAHLDAEFVQGTVEELPTHLDGEFDMVFTSEGVLCWIGDLARWAEVIGHFLKPGGMFAMVEGHPFTGMFDPDRNDDRLELDRNCHYFTKGPVNWPSEGSYAAGDANRECDHHFEWMHPISNIIMALIGAGLTLETFLEHPETFYPTFPFLVQGEDRLWRVPEGHPQFPLAFTVTARR